MQNYKNNQSVNDGNAVMDVSILSVIGDRDSQQDSFGYSLKGREGIVVVCDGMGGHEGGQIASTISTERFIQDFNDHYPLMDPQQQLIESARAGDQRISQLKNNAGERLNAGSTCVAVVISDHRLYWCSVGDSRAYLMRGEEFVQLTQDQNYGTVLSEKLNTGLIDQKQFEVEGKRKDALISYLGIGDLGLIDYNQSAFALECGDKLVLMTDGLYKLADDTEIRRVLENFKNSSEALLALDMKAGKNSRAAGKSRDNMTVAVITIKS